jgi:hypothetical protein
VSRIRDIQEQQRFLATEAEREQLIRDEHERPLKEALAEQEELLRQKRQLELEAITSGKRDPDFRIPDDALNLRMSVADANKFSKASAEAFIASEPSYFRCSENMTTLTNYLVNHDVGIATLETFKAAFKRLSELGLMIPHPALSRVDVEAQVREIAESIDWKNEASIREGQSRLEQLKQESEPPVEEQPEPTAKEKYFSDVVLETEDGKTFTESDIDALTADQFAALVKLKRVNRYSEMKRH